MDAHTGEPGIDIVNGAGGSHIDVMVNGTMDAQRWQRLEARLLRMVEVRQPAELRLRVAGSHDPGWTPTGLQALEGALREFGGRLVVDLARR